MQSSLFCSKYILCAKYKDRNIDNYIHFICSICFDKYQSKKYMQYVTFEEKQCLCFKLQYYIPICMQFNYCKCSRKYTCSGISLPIDYCNSIYKAQKYGHSPKHFVNLCIIIILFCLFFFLLPILTSYSDFI